MDVIQAYGVTHTPTLAFFNKVRNATHVFCFFFVVVWDSEQMISPCWGPPPYLSVGHVVADEIRLGP